jgi:hypothetical protein
MEIVDKQLKDWIHGLPETTPALMKIGHCGKNKLHSRQHFSSRETTAAPSGNTRAGGRKPRGRRMPSATQARIYGSPSHVFAKLTKMPSSFAKPLDRRFLDFFCKNKNAKPICKTVGVALRRRV